jgi:hypothetical protein
MSATITETMNGNSMMTEWGNWVTLYAPDHKKDAHIANTGRCLKELHFT